MKGAILAVLAAATLAVAQPHNHQHQHQHLHAKRAAHQHQHPQVVKRVAEPQGPPTEVYSTVWVCQLGDVTLSEEECQQGIANGTLVSPDGPLSQPPKSSWSPPTSSSSTPTSTSTSSSSTPPPPPTTTSSSKTSSSTPPPPPPSTSSSSSAVASANVVQAAAATPSSHASGYIGSGSSSSSSGSGVTSDFPDGQIACTDFPDEYGAQSVSWLGLGGWTGVQCPGDALGGFSDILTVPSGGSCKEGCYCSYACPAGYQKIQWPSLQGLTGQSVGGLQCKGGKLHLTNSDFSTLCVQGATQVTVQIQNTMSKNSAVCRTDYPGTESETIPLNTEPGSTNPLTCPNSATYYFWKGAQTSAQYYVNNAGVSVEDACQWSSAGTNNGNFAPVNLGVGYSNGAAWLAIMANKPTNPDALLNFEIELQGDNMSGTCKYSNGQYCSGANYDNCNSDGCTVSVSSGTATYVFS